MARYTPGASAGASTTYTKYTVNTTLTNPMPDVIAIGASGSFTLTLPNASGASQGKRYYVKDVSGSAGTHNIVIAGSSGQTIDGAANYTLSSNYAAAGIATDGSNWFII